MYLLFLFPFLSFMLFLAYDLDFFKKTSTQGIWVVSYYSAIMGATIIFQNTASYFYSPRKPERVLYISRSKYLPWVAFLSIGPLSYLFIVVLPGQDIIFLKLATSTIISSLLAAAISFICLFYFLYYNFLRKPVFAVFKEGFESSSFFFGKRFYNWSNFHKVRVLEESINLRTKPGFLLRKKRKLLILEMRDESKFMSSQNFIQHFLTNFFFSPLESIVIRKNSFLVLNGDKFREDFNDFQRVFNHLKTHSQRHKLPSKNLIFYGRH